MTETGLSAADIAAVTDRNGYGYGCGNGWGNNGMFGMEWIFALLILPMLWGGNGPFGRNGGGEPVTESALCNANSFNELKSSVGRGFDQQTQFAFQNQRDLCTSTATLSAQIAETAAAAAAQQAQCCCDTKQILLENRYLAERNAANSDAVTVAQTQKILDALCGNRMADMQNQINQLQLQAALCGVIRYPNQTTYNAGFNPFFNNGCGCCGNGNI